MHLDLATLARPRRLARAQPETIPTKFCRTCKTPRPLIAFARHPLSKDGHRHDCAKCVKAGRTPKPTQSTAERTKRARRHRKANPHVQAQNRIAVASYARRNPKAGKARAAVRKALRQGAITRPTRCQIHGCSKTRVEGHHHDYDRPLEVLWPCRSHHHRIHHGEVFRLKADVDRRLARVPQGAAA